MATTFPKSIEGTMLATTTGPDSRAGERFHLFVMNTGEYALVQSWLAWCPHNGTRRVYAIDSRIGSHPTVEQALERFDSYVATGV